MIHALHLALEALLVHGLSCHLALPLEPPSNCARWDGTLTLLFLKGVCTLRARLCLPRLLAKGTCFSAEDALP